MYTYIINSGWYKQVSFVQPPLSLCPHRTPDICLPFETHDEDHLTRLGWVLVPCLARNITWIPPPELEDGLYNLNFPEDDESPYPTIARIGNITLYENAHTPQLEHDLVPRALPLPISRKGCPNKAVPLDPDDHFATRQAIWNWCRADRLTWGATVQLALKGTVMYWVCNHDYRLFVSERVPCRLDEIMDAERVFNETCGANKGAWITMKEWRKNYGRGPVGPRWLCKDFK